MNIEQVAEIINGITCRNTKFIVRQIGDSLDLTVTRRVPDARYPWPDEPVDDYYWDNFRSEDPYIDISQPTYRVVDRRSEVTVMNRNTIPLFSLTDEYSVLDFVRHCIIKMETHEIDEWFSYRKTKPFYPH